MHPHLAPAPSPSLKDKFQFFIGRFRPDDEVEEQTSLSGLPALVGAEQSASAFELLHIFYPFIIHNKST